MTYLICLLSVMICIFNCEEFMYGPFEDCIGLRNSYYCSLISESLLGNARVTMIILQKCLGTFSWKTGTILLTIIFREFRFNFNVRCVSRKFTTYSCIHLSKKWLLMRFILSVVLERTVRLLALVIDAVLEEYNNFLSINKWQMIGC